MARVERHIAFRRFGNKPAGPAAPYQAYIYCELSKLWRVVCRHTSDMIRIECEYLTFMKEDPPQTNS